MLTDRDQVSEDSVAVWDRLYTHLTLLTLRGVMSAEELAHVFAPLLVTFDSYKSQSVSQV